MLLAFFIFFVISTHNMDLQPSDLNPDETNTLVCVQAIENWDIPLKIRVHGDELVTLIERYQVLPYTAEILLTNTNDNTNQIQIELYRGFRDIYKANERFSLLSVELEPGKYCGGCAQVKVRVEASSNSNVEISAFSAPENWLSLPTEIADEQLPAFSKKLPRKWSFHGPNVIPHIGFVFRDSFIRMAKRRKVDDPSRLAPENPEVTAHKVWPNSYYLAKYLTDNPDIISNAENIISLGAGRALTAVTIAKLFNRQIVVTDLEENLPLIEESCELNEVSDMITISSLDWTENLNKEFTDVQWDLIFVSDCVFWPQLHNPLVSTLHSLSHENTIILLCLTERLRTVQLFFDESFDMTVTSVIDMPDDFAKLYIAKP